MEEVQWFHIVSILFLTYSLVVYALPLPPRQVRFTAHPWAWFYWRVSCLLVLWYVTTAILVILVYKLSRKTRLDVVDDNVDSLFLWGFLAALAFVIAYVVASVLYEYFQRARSTCCCCPGQICINDHETLDEKAWSVALGGLTTSAFAMLVPGDLFEHLSVTFLIFVASVLLLNWVFNKILVFMAVRIQFAAVLSATAVYSFLFTWKHESGWLLETPDFYGVSFAVSIGMTVFKVLYDWLYDRHCRAPNAYQLVEMSPSPQPQQPIVPQE